MAADFPISSRDVSFVPPTGKFRSRGLTEASTIGIGVGAMPDRIAVKSERTQVVKAYQNPETIMEDGEIMLWRYTSADNHVLEVLND